MYLAFMWYHNENYESAATVVLLRDTFEGDTLPTLLYTTEA